MASYYSQAFKRMVVQKHEQEGYSKEELRRAYDIAGKTTILSWCRKYGSAPPQKDAEPYEAPL
jgi:transposase-like protein